MKHLLLAVFAFSGAMACFGQDTTGTEKVDTIRVGGMIIIKKKGTDEDGKKSEHIEVNKNHHKKNPNISTNWWIVDLGFVNYNDNTNYADAQASGFVASNVGKEQLDLKTSKSVNVNIWFFMQKLNLVKHVMNLKYGMGLELNNYHFDEDRVRFYKNPTKIVLDPALENVKKNKLAADYITVPMLLNFNFTPKQNKGGFGISAGVSAGYLYSSRWKYKFSDQKTKLHDDFDLKDWKLSYIGELNLGPVKLYGSYAMSTMWEKGLDQTPYSVGIRLSNW